MTIHKMSSVDAFIAFDFDDADAAVGMVRCAPKVLQGGAKELARSASYTFALLEMQVGGASAGINAKGEAVPDAVSGFVAEAADLVSSGRFLPEPGKGVSEADLTPLRESDPRTPVAYESANRLIAAGAVAAAVAALGGLEAKTALIDAPDPLRLEVVGLATAAGANVVDAVDTADVMFSGSKMGAVDHNLAADLQLGALVPIHPIPFTTKALLTLQRAGTVVVPDSISLLGPALAGWTPGDLAAAEAATVERVSGLMAELSDAEEGLFLAACKKAEDFLSTWREELPFGRPLAP